MMKTKNYLIHLIIVIFLASCAKDMIDDKIQNFSDAPAEFGVSSVSVLNNQLVLSGFGLGNVTEVKVVGGDLNETLSVESQNNDTIIANGIRGITIAAGTIFNVLISNANGAASFPVTFVPEDGSITAVMLDQMGANDGEFLMWDNGGSTWTPVSLNNLNYRGTWDARTFGEGGPDTDPTGSPSSGDFYVVSESGSHDLNGIATWNQGDWAIYNGAWERINYATNVSSVFDRVGPVVAEANDYTWEQIDKSSSTLGGIADVYITATPTADYVLAWNDVDERWEPADISIAPDTITTDELADDSVGTASIINETISNADISTTAAIAYSKLDISDDDIPMAKIDGLDSSLGARLALTGGTMTGDINMNGNDINTVGLVDNVDISALESSVAGVVVDSVTNGVVTTAPSQNAVFDELALKQDLITGTTDLNVRTLSPSVQGGIILPPFSVAAGGTSEIRFQELAINGGNYVGLKAPDLIADPGVIWTLPTLDGSNGQLLKTDGSGNLSWVDDATGSFGTLSLDDLSDTTQINTNLSLGNPNDATQTAANVFVGIDAGLNTYGSNGSSNVAVGYQALYNNYSGPYNVAIGRQALYSLTDATSGYNLAIGGEALFSLSSGQYNVAIGNESQYTSNGDNSISIGHQSLKFGSGDNNIAIGYKAMINSTSSSRNIALGSESMDGVSSGTDNVAIGHNSLRSPIAGNRNVAVGGSAVYKGNNVTGVTAVGYNAGSNLITPADYNTLIGYQAGDNLISGSNNILIGASVDASETTTSDSLNIGNTIYGDLTNANIGIGVNPPNEKLTVDGVVSLKAGPAPASTSSYGKLYVDSGGTSLYFVNSAGIQTDLTALAPNNLFFPDGSVDMTGSLSVIAGSSSSPGITFVSDTSTGLYSPATGAMSFVSNGTETLRIDDSGNIGIGNASPSATLDVSGGAYFTGNVAIGTATTPSSKFKISDSFDVQEGTNYESFNISTSLNPSGVINTTETYYSAQKTEVTIPATHSTADTELYAVGHSVELLNKGVGDIKGLIGLKGSVGTDTTSTESPESIYGVNYLAQHSANSSSTVSGVYGASFSGELFSNGYSNSVDSIYGGSFNVNLTAIMGGGASTANYAYGIKSALSFGGFGGGVSSLGTAYGGHYSISNSGGSISNAYNIYIDSPSSSSTNAYGLYIGGLGTVTNNKYGIYVSNGDNYFAENVGIGTITPQNKLDVKGGVAIGASYAGSEAASSNGLIVEGNVGIGVTAPASKLEVDGDIIVGNSGDVCTAANEGASRYNSTTRKMEYCDSTAWITIGDPSGTVQAFAGTSCPAGWLYADGSTVATADYPGLFAAIAYMYGGGGANFDLPDYRGYFLRGHDDGTGTDPDAGTRTDRGDGTTGDNVGTKQDDEFERHHHDLYGSDAGGVDERGLSDGSGNGGIVGEDNEGSASYTSQSGYGGNEYYVDDNDGGDESRPKNINVRYCIRE